jgi:Skp family chaperone for outer membrane proteins
MRVFGAMGFVLGLAAASVSAQTGGAASPLIAVVSAQRVGTQSDEGKAGQARIQTFQRDRANELRSRQQTLNDTRLKLASATETDDRVELQQQEAVQRADFERATAEAQRDLQNLQRQVGAQIQARVRQALDAILKGRDVLVVLPQETAVLWAAPGLDLTDEVIAWLDKNPPAAPGR